MYSFDISEREAGILIDALLTYERSKLRIDQRMRWGAKPLRWRILRLLYPDLDERLRDEEKRKRNPVVEMPKPKARKRKATR
jgi:hypothetical protein